MGIDVSISLYSYRSILGLIMSNMDFILANKGTSLEICTRISISFTAFKNASKLSFPCYSMFFYKSASKKGIAFFMSSSLNFWFSGSLLFWLISRSRLLSKASFSFSKITYGCLYCSARSSMGFWSEYIILLCFAAASAIV